MDKRAAGVRTESAQEEEEDQKVTMRNVTAKVSGCTFVHCGDFMGILSALSTLINSINFCK